MAALPSAPVLGTSFTAISTNNPSQQQPGNLIDAEFNRTNAAVASILAALAVSLNADGTLNSAAVEQAYDALSGGNTGNEVNLADAPSALSALLAQAWAEYLSGPLPAETLAGTGVTGDHYSSRWWANFAASAVQSAALQAYEQVSAALAADYIGAHLPTVAPPLGGYWNNGGSVCLAPGPLAANLPVVPPAGGGFWNNGGSLCVV